MNSVNPSPRARGAKVGFRAQFATALEARQWLRRGCRRAVAPFGRARTAGSFLRDRRLPTKNGAALLCVPCLRSRVKGKALKRPSALDTSTQAWCVIVKGWTPAQSGGKLCALSELYCVAALLEGDHSPNVRIAIVSRFMSTWVFTRKRIKNASERRSGACRAIPALSFRACTCNRCYLLSQ